MAQYSRGVVYVAVFGSGLGHAYRASILIESLADAGYGLVTSSWAQGYRFFRLESNLPSIETIGIDVNWGEEGKMLFKKTLRDSSKIFSSFFRQIVVEYGIEKRLRPSLVLSDSRAAPLLAAKALNTPSILLANQLKILLPRVSGHVRYMLELLPAQAISALWNFADIVLVPDLPPPYTIAEEQLKHIPALKNKILYLGPLVKRGDKNILSRAVAGFLGKARKLVLFSISGPDKTKKPMLELARVSARVLERKGWHAVISAGFVGGKRIPKRVSERILEFEWCEYLDALMQKADVVVARSGHATVTKLAYLGKPSVLLPIPFHGEQESNALKAERLGFARVLLRADTAKAVELANIVEEIYSENSYLESARFLSRIAKAYDPKRIFLSLVDKLVSS